MNGFNPLGGIKEWHIKIICVLAATGIVLSVWKLIELIIWIYKHIKFI